MMRDININNIIVGWKNWALNELGILDPNTKAMADKRLAVCETCPKRDAAKCGVCGCYLPAKAASPNSNCPDNPTRW